MRKWFLILSHAFVHRRILVWAFPLAIISGVVAVLQPWPMKILVDNVLGDSPVPAFLQGSLRALSLDTGRTGLLMLVAISSLGLFAAGRLIGVLLAWISIRGSWATVYGLAASVFERLLHRSLAFHKSTAVGELMNRVLGDSRCAQQVLENLLFAPTVAIIMVGAMIVLMVRIDPFLTLLAFLAAPLSWSLAILMSGRLRSAARQNREVEGQIQSQVQQTFSGIGVVLAFAQGEHEGSRFRNLAEQHIHLQRRGLLLGGINNLGTGLISVLASALVLWLIARHVIQNRVSLGSALLFLAYFNTLQGQLGVFRGLWTQIPSVGESAGRVAHVLDAVCEIADSPSALPLPVIRGEVEFKKVTAGYGAKAVLKNISLHVRAGQTVGIVGPTGSGKTTLLNLILRLDDPWEGSVHIDGHDVRNVSVRSLREQVTMVLQDSWLISASVADNIRYGRPDATSEEVEAAARAAQAHDFIAALPQGYDTIIGERGAILSGGMRQRLAIARALVKKAPILILDEPSSALDVETEAKIFQVLQALRKSCTTFVIAHRLSTVRHADLIVILKDGEIVENGTHEALLAKCGYYAQMQSAAEGQGEPRAAELCRQ